MGGTERHETQSVVLGRNLLLRGTWTHIEPQPILPSFWRRHEEDPAEDPLQDASWTLHRPWPHPPLCYVSQEQQYLEMDVAS